MEEKVEQPQESKSSKKKSQFPRVTAASGAKLLDGVRYVEEVTDVVLRQVVSLKLDVTPAQFKAQVAKLTEVLGDLPEQQLKLSELTLDDLKEMSPGAAAGLCRCPEAPVGLGQEYHEYRLSKQRRR